MEKITITTMIRDHKQMTLSPTPVLLPSEALTGTLNDSSAEFVFRLLNCPSPGSSSGRKAKAEAQRSALGFKASCWRLSELD